MNTELSTTLAVNIRESYAEAMLQAGNVKAHARIALEEAVRCGELLTEARNETRSAFAEWLRANCPEVESEVASRFISGAKKIRERGIDTFGGAQLLLFFAESEAKAERPQTDRDPQGTNWLTQIDRVTALFTKTLDHRPVGEWSEAERLTFKQRVKPIVELYGTL